MTTRLVLGRLRNEDFKFKARLELHSETLSQIKMKQTKTKSVPKILKYEVNFGIYIAQIIYFVFSEL